MPLSAQPSLEMMMRADDFRQKHYDRSLELHANIEKVYRNKYVQEKKNMKEDEDELKNAEQQLMEKIKKVENLEQEILDLEAEQEKEQKQDLGSDSTTTAGPEVYGATAAASGVTEKYEKESFTTGEGSLAATSKPEFLSF